MAYFPDKAALTQILWNNIYIPEISLLPVAQQAAIEQEAKSTFIDSLLNHARPEHVEFIMRQAMEGKYRAFLGIHETVGYLSDPVSTGEIRYKLPPYYHNDTAGGLANKGWTINALYVVDRYNRLKSRIPGKFICDPLFMRRVIHETAHVLDLDHPEGQYSYSGSQEYIEARTKDRFHAIIMAKIQEKMGSNHIFLSPQEKEALEKEYQEEKIKHEARLRGVHNDGITFAINYHEFLPPTVEKYFLWLAEENGVVSEKMGQLLASEPNMAHDPVNAYIKLLRKQYDEFDEIKGDRQFIKKLGEDIQDKVKKRIVEIGYYDRKSRVNESIAKAIDGFNVNLNPDGRPLPGGRNPIAAMHMPHLEEHIETHVYEDLHQRNLQARARLMPMLEEVWQQCGLNPQDQIRLLEQDKVARRGQGTQASKRHREQQKLRREAIENTPQEPEQQPPQQQPAGAKQHQDNQIPEAERTPPGGSAPVPEENNVSTGGGGGYYSSSVSTRTDTRGMVASGIITTMIAGAVIGDGIRRFSKARNREDDEQRKHHAFWLAVETVIAATGIAVVWMNREAIGGALSRSR